MKNKSLKIGAYSTAISIIIIAVAVIVNMLISAFPAEYTKFDTTGLDLYGLTDATIDIIKGVDQDVTIYHIARDGYEDGTIEEFISRYADFNSRLTVKVLDPAVTPSLTTDNEQHDLTTMEENSLILSTSLRDKVVAYSSIYTQPYSEYELYMIAMQSGQYPDNPTTFEAEQAVTGALDFVTTGDLPMIYVLEGHGETPLSEAYSNYLATDNYETVTFSLVSGEGKVPEDAACVLINNPTSDISADELEALKAYVDNGGKVVMLTTFNLDGVVLNNVQELGAYYGMNTVEGMVVEGDPQHYYQYPYYIIPDISAADSITSELGDSPVIMSMAQGFTISDTLPEGVTVSNILTTSDKAYTVILSENQTEEPEHIYDGQCVLGAVATVTESEGSFAWYTSGALTDEGFDQVVSGGNSKLFLSTLRQFCDKESSVAIAGKVMSIQRLVVPEVSAKFYSTLFTVAVPVTVIIIGLFVWLIRRKK